MKKRLLMIVAAMMTAASSLTGCSLVSVNPNEVVVKVNDSEITADVANFYARYTQAQYETYFGAYTQGDMWNTKAEEGKTYEESVKASIQEELKQMFLLEQHMKDYNVSLSDAEKEVIQKAAKEFDEDNSLENKEKIMADVGFLLGGQAAVFPLPAGAQPQGGGKQDAGEKAVQDVEKSLFFIHGSLPPLGLS